MEALTSEKYFTRRLELAQKLRDTQRNLDHQRRIFRWWTILAIALIALFSGGIAGGIYLGLGWYWLTALSVIGAIVFLVGFLADDFYSGPKKLANALSLRKEVAEVKNQQQLLEEEWKEGLAALKYPDFYRYILVPQIVETYQRQSRFNRTFHLSLQVIVIIASLFVSALTSGFDIKIGLTLPWIAPALSLVVSFCTTIMGFFKFRERSLHMQQTADAIEQERTALELGIGTYRRVPSGETFAEFAERVEKLREEQRKAQQQLEQSPVNKKQEQAGPA